jgi:hypothetical protein
VLATPVRGPAVDATLEGDDLHAPSARCGPQLPGSARAAAAEAGFKAARRRVEEEEEEKAG